MKKELKSVSNKMNVKDLQKQIEAADNAIASIKECTEGRHVG